MKRKRLATILALSAPFLPGMVSGVACFPEDPLKYFSRNACDFVNCDVLFFIEDMFPLSERPQGGGGGGEMVMDMPAAEEEESAHMH